MIDETLNKILKEMWRLEEKVVIGKELTAEEKKFFDSNLTTIQSYYAQNNIYWQNKNPLT